MPLKTPPHPLQFMKRLGLEGNGNLLEPPKIRIGPKKPDCEGHPHAIELQPK